MAISDTMRLEVEHGPDRSVKLTRRELEVLELIAAGHHSIEAADVLCLSKRTVDFHLSNVYGKLGAGNRMQAVRAAERLGMLAFEPRSG